MWVLNDLDKKHCKLLLGMFIFILKTQLKVNNLIKYKINLKN